MVNQHGALLATLCVAASMFSVPTIAFADGHIEVSLRTPAARDPLHPAMLAVRIENTGDKPVSIMKWDTPFVASGGRLPKSMFEVTDAAGNEVAYRGSWVYFGRLTMESFITVYPGEVLSKELDLAAEYRFEPNASYKVRYVLDLTREPDPYVVSSAERASFSASEQKKASSAEVIISFGSEVSVQRRSNPAEDYKRDAQQALTISRVRGPRSIA